MKKKTLEFMLDETVNELKMLRSLTKEMSQSLKFKEDTINNLSLNLDAAREQLANKDNVNQLLTAKLRQKEQNQ